MNNAIAKIAFYNFITTLCDRIINQLLFLVLKYLMMKTFYLIRHAKSSWEDNSLSDADRPLNARGLRDAPFMAKMLKGKQIKIDQIISSPANRAFTTANYFAEAFEVKADDILVKEEIYEAYAEQVLEIVKNLPDTLEEVIVFGHNPSFTSLANIFSEEYIPNVPTCGIIKVVANTDKWSEINATNGKVGAFYFPKQYF